MSMPIAGLEYIPDFLDISEQAAYLKAIDNEEWLADLKRRVQHYGYSYPYKTRRIDRSMYLGDLPDWAKQLADRLFNERITPFVADQVIINEYLPGQGISAHIDSPLSFGDPIVSISLESNCVMNFQAIDRSECQLLLAPGSLLKLSGEARYKWKHSIAARKTDSYEGQIWKRSRRVSITLRQVKLSD
jgi:alkylated DNA repair dioxygenase AlkB